MPLDFSSHEGFRQRLRWLPSTSIILWLAIFLWLNLAPSRWMLIGIDSDTCWHWQQGNWILQHHSVPQTEIFSHTRSGSPVANLAWLSDILLALAGNLFGWGGIVLLAASVCATYVWLLHRQLLAERNELLLATALTLLAAAVCEMHWLARPHLATHLLVVVFAWQLRGFERERVSARQLMTRLPVLTALWANLHGAFGTAFVLLGIYFAGTIVDYVFATGERRPALRRRAMVLAAVGAVCVLASMLNPNGWKLLARVFEYTSSPAVVGLPQENLPPRFSDPVLRPFILFLAVTVLMMPVCRPYLRVTDGLLLVVWFLLSLRMVRQAPLFALIATPILAEHWNEYFRSARPSRLMQAYRKFSAKLTALNQSAGGGAWPALAVVVMVFVLAKPVLRTELPADRFPVAAVEFLKQSPDAVRGEMFNEFVWGGYLIWALPERKVFIHPNLNAYGVKLVEDYIAASKAGSDWDQILTKYNVGWTILPRDHPLNRALAQSIRWRLVHADAVATIYARAH